jgi:uncharacterized protein YbjT (DUF2867 family)
MTMTVLVAGSTGYLGKFAARAFKQRGYRVRALTRSKERLGKPGPFTAPPVDEFVDEVFVGEVTKPETLSGLMDGVDFVFSSIGISRQRDGLTCCWISPRGPASGSSSTYRSGDRTKSAISKS